MAPVAPMAPAQEPVPAPGQPKRPKSRVRSLDGMRLLAALMVALYHYTARSQTTKYWGDSPKELFGHLSAIGAYGPLGVQWFFLISGFVICMSSWGRSLSDFFRSRASRLYPAYWVAVILTTVACLVAPAVSKPLRLDQVILNLTLLQEPAGAPRVIGVDWTLWVEIRFYVLFALLVVWHGVTYRRVVLFCCVWTVASVVVAQTDNALLDQIVMHDQAPFFIGGLALYLVHRFGSRPLLWGIVGVSWALGQWYATGALWNPGAKVVYLARSPHVVLLIVTVAYVAVAFAALGWLRWANWPWLTVAGALTYPFYLIHEHLGWFVITAGRHLHLPPPVTLVTTVAVVLGLAYGIHRLVERPLGPRLNRALRSRSDDVDRPVRTAEPVTSSSRTVHLEPDARSRASGSVG